jgi:hypothetical protein
MCTRLQASDGTRARHDGLAQALTNGAQSGFVRGSQLPPEKDHYNKQWRTGTSMKNIQSKATFALVVIAVIGLNSVFAQPQTSSVQTDRGADRVGFSDLANYLPATRTPSCAFEYRTLVRAFKKEITPHIDPEMARRVLDTNWLERLETEPLPQQ